MNVDEDRYVEERGRMVERQILSRGIRHERLLAAMRRVPRDQFVPTDVLPRAYHDGPLPIGNGQTISQPYIVALMTSLLDLTGDEKVLEIGTGSGYQTAILAEMGVAVYTVEIVETLSLSAQRLLARLGYANICYRVGDGTQGWAEHAPFDRIIGTAAPKRLPPTLGNQLVVGGWAVLPIGGFAQTLTVVRRTSDGMRTDDHGGVVFVPMTGEAQEL